MIQRDRLVRRRDGVAGNQGYISNVKILGSLPRLKKDRPAPRATAAFSFRGHYCHGQLSINPASAPPHLAPSEISKQARTRRSSAIAGEIESCLESRLLGAGIAPKHGSRGNCVCPGLLLFLYSFSTILLSFSRPLLFSCTCCRQRPHRSPLEPCWQRRNADRLFPASNYLHQIHQYLRTLGGLGPIPLLPSLPQQELLHAQRIN